MKVYKNAYELIGNTPLLELTKVEKEFDLKANLFAKVELFNPAGSVKDRVAYQMIIDAEEKGLINKDTTLIEPTSGNTGIGIASVGASRGYKVIIVMPSTMSAERVTLMKAYGANVVLSDGTKGMKGAISEAERLAKELNGVILGQFTNPSNVKAHYLTTGPEIYNDLDGKVDMFVAGVGTGGTISGVGKYLKEQNKDICVVAVEPEDSQVIGKNTPGPHKIQGIGAGFIPDILDLKVIDKVIPISNDDAFKCGKMLGLKEGILVGISSGASLKAAINLAKLEENKGKNIVVLLPDSGDRYLSTDLFK